MIKPNSLSYENKIHDSVDFQQVYKKGKKFVTAYFIWFFLKDGGEPRLGITVTKGVGKANERNRIKRQVRETFRQNKEALPTGKIVVKARFKAAGIDNNGLRADLKGGFLSI